MDLPDFETVEILPIGPGTVQDANGSNGKSRSSPSQSGECGGCMVAATIGGKLRNEGTDHSWFTSWR